MATIGIDLGTTNSLVVAYIQDEVKMIPNVYGEYLTPSVVNIEKEGSVVVGKVAKERLITHAQDTTSLFKRKMGTSHQVNLQGKNYLPEELSAFVVKQLVEDAEKFLGEAVEEIVISVPAYFNNAQRSATKRIGNILGIKIDRLVNEPSAASIACHYGNKQDESFIVFDFGGGTLDVSIVDCFDNVVSICAIAGNNQLGGSDFDKLIANDFCQQHELSFDALPQKQQESLLYHCEKAKINLQKQARSKIEMHFDDKFITYELSTERLRFLGSSIFEKMKSVIADAVNNSGFKKGEIDKIVMVGGSCHMPVVSSFLRNLMNIDVYENMDKDFMVAHGLGLYVGIKQRVLSVKSLVLTDICPFSLSISTHNELDIRRSFSDVIIPKNTVLPSSRKKNYQTINLGQSEVKLEVYQGEGIYASQNTLLTTHTIKVPKNKARHEHFDVTFTYDINSILYIEVNVITTNEKMVFTIDNQPVDTAMYDSIKRASLKLSLEPKLEFLDEQMKRLMEESDAYKQEWLKQTYIEFIHMMEEHKNNLRKRAIILSRMEEIIANIENEIENCDFFQDIDDEDGGSANGLLS